MTARWLIARVRPGLLTRALENMERQNYAPYAPRIMARGPRGAPRPQPMFPGYVFVAFPEDGRWMPLNSTIGVLGVIMGAGEQPALLPGTEIEKIRAREDDSGLVHLEARARARGDPVRVDSGALHLDAIYDGMAGRDRVFVLMQVLGRWTRVKVSAEDVHE